MRLPGLQFFLPQADGSIKITTDVLEWGGWMEDPENRTVSVTDVSTNPPIIVSTVCLGIDLGHGRSAVPLIYETMIFGGESNEVMDRYGSLKEAFEGHERCVAVAKARVGLR